MMAISVYFTLLFLTTISSTYCFTFAPFRISGRKDIIVIKNAVGPRDSSSETRGVNAPSPRRPPPGVGSSSKGGGPPPPTAGQQFLEEFLEVAFKFLYLWDDSGVVETSKNLRVLWTRALLSNLGLIDDDVAYDLLPRSTRAIVKAPIYGPFLDKLDFIVKRTKFIDGQLEEWLRDTNGSDRRQLIVLGAGYDTRAIRYQSQGLEVYEIDLPTMAEKKSSMERFYLENMNKTLSLNIQHVPLDLNEIFTYSKSLVEILEERGFQVDDKTFVVCEAVLFYLVPNAVQKLLTEVFQLPECRYCITDSLSKVGVKPGGPPTPSAKEKCEAWLVRNGKQLVAHDAVFGGAIHFVGAK